MSIRRDHKELVVITKTYDLILWSCHHTGKFPRNHRFVLGERTGRGQERVGGRCEVRGALGGAGDGPMTAVIGGIRGRRSPAVGANFAKKRLPSGQRRRYSAARAIRRGFNPHSGRLSAVQSNGNLS
jgi:hypothetical protein